MKEVIFYILMVYNSNHNEAVWTFSPKLTEEECIQLKAAMESEARDASGWRGRAVSAPQFSKCVPITK